MTKLSSRMKDILFFLSKTDGMTRSHIICAVEGKQWKELVKRSSGETMQHISELLPLDKVRVSYDRTFRRLRELGLVEGGIPSGLPRSSPYQGTKWRGYVYRLTDKGKKMAGEIMDEILKPLIRYSDMLINFDEEQLEDSTL